MNAENLWAPWRGAYLRELERRSQAAEPSDGGNFLLEYWRAPERDAAHLVIHRDSHGIVLLNRYPYTNGHLVVALGDGRPSLLDYEPPQRAAFWRLVEVGTTLMQQALRPQGINLGINQGRAAGAGVPGHLHAHLVPRWDGDTNFISVVGQVRVQPDSLEEMHRLYVAAREMLGDVVQLGAGARGKNCGAAAGRAGRTARRRRGTRGKNCAAPPRDAREELRGAAAGRAGRTARRRRGTRGKNCAASPRPAAHAG